MKICHFKRWAPSKNRFITWCRQVDKQNPSKKKTSLIAIAFQFRSSSSYMKRNNNQPENCYRKNVKTLSVEKETEAHTYTQSVSHSNDDYALIGCPCNQSLEMLRYDGIRIYKSSMVGSCAFSFMVNSTFSVGQLVGWSHLYAKYSIVVSVFGFIFTFSLSLSLFLASFAEYCSHIRVTFFFLLNMYALLSFAKRFEVAPALT